MTAFDDAVRAVREGRPPAEAAADLYAVLTEDERLWLLDGDTECWEGLARFRTEGYNTVPIVHGQVERLGLPGTRFVDGPRGCVAGHGTAFPVSMARGATWDVDLEERVGDVIGREIRALGGNFFGGVCINLPRHPAWGRAQETYGDDPHHLGEFGAALTRGTQRWVMACAKHYALNSMENARFVVDVTADEATLHDMYLPHFKRVVDEGVAAIMGAYNSVNGEWCGQNTYLLTTVLRDVWGWDGITVTDFIYGLRDAAGSLNAGMDLEEPFRQQRAERLVGQLDAGATSWDMVERAGVRLIAAQLRSYASRAEAAPPADVVANAEARALARTVAARGMVLLKNDPVEGRPVLPLDPASVRSIALLGRLATAGNMGDHGSSLVRPPSWVSPYDGLRAAFPAADLRLVASDDVDEARRAAAEADVAIVVAGFSAADEGEYIGPDSAMTPELFSLFPPIPQSAAALLGEAFGGENEDHGTGGDRESLALRPVDEDLIRAVADVNPRTVVAIVAAGAVLTESWRAAVPAVLMMWYAGMEGGHALADVLHGRAESRAAAFPSRFRPRRRTCRSSIATPRRSPTTTSTASGCSTASVSARRSHTGSACPIRRTRYARPKCDRPRRIVPWSPSRWPIRVPATAPTSSRSTGGVRVVPTPVSSPWSASLRSASLRVPWPPSRSRCHSLPSAPGIRRSVAASFRRPATSNSRLAHMPTIRQPK